MKKTTKSQIMLEIVPDGVTFYRVTASRFDNKVDDFCTRHPRKILGDLHVTASRVKGCRPSGYSSKGDDPEGFKEGQRQEYI